MPRPLLTDRPVAFKVYLPESLATRLQLYLWSPTEERVPHGALSKYVESLVRADLDAKASQLPEQAA